jgi:hypothetical protein
MGLDVCAVNGSKQRNNQAVASSNINYNGALCFRAATKRVPNHIPPMKALGYVAPLPIGKAMSAGYPGTCIAPSGTYSSRTTE